MTPSAMPADEPAEGHPAAGPRFDDAFRSRFEALVRWRRDVRRFARDPVADALVSDLLDLAQLSPSVGNSQPWRWVRVDDAARRAAVRENFRACNAAALASLNGERARTYATLKLEGLEAAPVQFAVFCDRATDQGEGLGCRTMPEMLDYSVVSMLTVFWLAARAFGLGVGWVSILEPAAVAETLAVDPGWHLVAYLCIGWPVEEHLDPELERHGWQMRTRRGREVLAR